jgi:hypothetical protein
MFMQVSLALNLCDLNCTFLSLDSYTITCESYFDLDVSYHSKYFCIVLHVC